MGVNNKQSILVVLVNYGREQINYLETVVKELKSFNKYNVTIIVNSNIEINMEGLEIGRAHV